MEDIKSDPLEQIKELQVELGLKDKEITLLINHCNTLIQQSNTLKLLDEYDSLLDENTYLYDYIDQLNLTSNDELKEFTIHMEEVITSNNKEQEHLNKLLYCKDTEIDILRERYNINKNMIEEHQDLIKKQNDELIDLNFIIYNQNKYLAERQEEINKLKNKVDEIQSLNNDYVSLIDEIKTFIANAQQSQYIPLFNPARIMDNLMILFNYPCHGDDFDPLLVSPEVSPLKPSKPKSKKMTKRLSNRS